MIQDIYPHKLNNQYDKNAIACKEDYVLCFDGDNLLIDEKKFDDKELMFPTVELLGIDREYTYLFSIDATRYFMVSKPEQLPVGFIFKDMKEVRHSELMPKHHIFAAVTGKHLKDWYRDNCFCGRCGSGMEHKDTERAMKCTSCGYTSYPRIMPAVIVGVTNGDKILLTRYRVGYQHNALIAGFTEIGETVEETVAREAMEEAGVKVKNIRYYKSQPWGVANDILMGFYCDVDGDTEIHMDNEELKYAEWVKREDIVLQPDEFSLTNEMMKIFKENKNI